MFNSLNLAYITLYLDSDYKQYHTVKYSEALTAELTFTTREEYLAWVTAWKKEYAQISKDSRQWKARRKMTHPEFEGLGVALRGVWTCRDRAVALLHLRLMGKQRAAELRMARLTAK